MFVSPFASVRRTNLAKSLFASNDISLHPVVASGVYFYRLTTDNGFAQSKAMVVLK